MIFNRNKLTFMLQYKYNDGYSLNEKMKKKDIKSIIKRFKTKTDNDEYVNILSKFNGLNYPVYDLDTKDNLDVFKRIHKDVPYVIFQSSLGEGLGKGTVQPHYWGILDSPYKKLNDIFTEHSWKVCNDQKYVKFCNNYNYITIRGLYKNYNDKPFLYETNGILSSNFNLFINNIKKHFYNEGFELSILRYHDTDLLEELMIRKRKDKIDKIKNRGKY